MHLGVLVTDFKRFQRNKQDFIFHFIYLFIFQMLDFFSDMCGVIGLWFGFAMMTFLEVFELVVDIGVMSIGNLIRRFAGGY